MWLIHHLLRFKIFRQFVKFSLVGVFNTFIDFGVYFILTRFLGLYYIIANLIANLIALTFSFFVNKKWTFRNKNNKVKEQYLKFFTVYIAYLLLYNLIFIAATHYLSQFKIGESDLWAKVIATIICLFWNFLANRFWTFRY